MPRSTCFTNTFIFFFKYFIIRLRSFIIYNMDLCPFSFPQALFLEVHSFSTCTLCKSQTAGNTAGGAQVGSLAALGFMYDFVLGALRPESLGYSAKNDLKAALQNRYMLGFNTQDTSVGNSMK